MWNPHMETLLAEKPKVLCKGTWGKRETLKTVKGTVTDLFPTRCTFKIDGTLPSYIHYGLLAAFEEGLLQVPYLNDSVVIHNAVLVETDEFHYFLTSESSIIIENNCNLHLCIYEEYAKVINRYQLTLEKVIIIHTEWNKMLLELFNDDEFFVHLLQVFGPDDIFPVIKTPKLVEYISFQTNYPGNSYFTSGVHHSSPHEVLMGYFKSDETAALFSLSDNESTLYMHVITKGENYKLKEYLNRLVYIDKFTILTESHRLEERTIGATNLLCILVDSKHIQLVRYKSEKEPNIDNIALKDYVDPALEIKRELIIMITNISVPVITWEKKIQIWLDAMILEDNDKWEPLFLCLDESFSSTIPLLDIGFVYRVLMPENWTIQKDYEIKRLMLGKFLRCMRISTKSIFIKVKNPNEFGFKDVFLDVETINEGCNTSGVTIIGRIKNRIVNESRQSSRTTRIDMNNKRFGTPGDNRNNILHLHLQTSSVIVTLYLNNWERKQCPIGLVPNTLVIVRNVDYFNQYTKSNIMTSFQIIGYQVDVPFNTVNLNSKVDTVFSSYFANTCIPCNVLIRGKTKVSGFKIFKLSHNENFQPTAFMCFKGSDALGSAEFINKGLVLVTHLLCRGNNERTQKFYALIKSLGPFSLQGNYKMEDSMTPLELPLLERWIKSLFVENVAIFEIVARRIEGHRNYDKCLPLWEVTDVLNINFH